MEFRSDLSAGLIATVQWVVTGFYSFLAAFSSVGWYLSSTQESYAVDGTPTALVFLSAVAVSGFAWGYHHPDGHGKRVEVLIWLLILGFVLPTGLYLVLPYLGLSTLGAELFAASILAYVLTLIVAYGLVYGLDLQLFLSDESESTGEW